MLLILVAGSHAIYIVGRKTSSAPHGAGDPGGEGRDSEADRGVFEEARGWVISCDNLHKQIQIGTFMGHFGTAFQEFKLTRASRLRHFQMDRHGETECSIVDTCYSKHSKQSSKQLLIFCCYLVGFPK